jgi:hypothetical protein
MTMQEDDSAPRDLTALLGEPALLKSEDANLYQCLKLEVEAYVNPQNIVEQMRVMDITNSAWESHRFRRHLVGLVEGERARALSHLVMPLVDLDHQKAFELANHYYAGSEKQKAIAARTLAQFGITDDQIEARASVSNSYSFATLNRGISVRDTMRRAILKEIARDKRRAEKAQRKNVKQGANANVVTAPAIQPEDVN